ETEAPVRPPPEPPVPAAPAEQPAFIPVVTYAKITRRQTAEPSNGRAVIPAAAAIGLAAAGIALAGFGIAKLLKRRG
ncbi:MAG: hypothetical protein FWH06_04760, partial [Oscillospiraceae bacterium]|nr:hypothetical protein [Oscillospiraceae bacterium]